jgi:hypothetical protein
MKRKVLSISVAAAWLISGLTAGAQTPVSPAATITVAGCVQQETSVLKRNPVVGDVGMSDEFVLIQATLNPRPAMDQPKDETEPLTDTPVGTAGSAAARNFGKVYRVTGSKENELKPYVGQRVEITGAFKNESDAKAELASVGVKGRNNTELTPANTPEITITAIRPVSGTCSGGADR